MVHESQKSFQEKCGKIASDEENHTMFISTQAFLAQRAKNKESTHTPEAFDSRTNWPTCAEKIGEIHNQGRCGSCWAFGALSAVDSRFCIATNAAFKSSHATISRGYTTSCAFKSSRPGHNGCN